MLVSNAVFALPSFKSRGSLVSNVFGNWQLNGILTLLSGIPLDVTTGLNGNYFGLASSAPGGFRPDLVSGVPIYLNGPDKTKYLNPAAFALPAPGVFGNLKRGFVRQPGLKNVDFSVAKNWKIHERYGIQFRAEMFNLFNTTNFNGFVNGLNSGSTFGTLNSDRGPRNIQFGFKFNF
jgi:hypothetical protein